MRQQLKNAFLGNLAGVALVAAAFGSILGGSAFASPFQNGSFESPPLNPGGLDFLGNGDTTVTGWTSTATTSEGNVLFNNGNCCAVASDGNQGIILNGDDGTLTTIYQTFDTISGQKYEVDFDLSRENGAPSSPGSPISVIATGGVSTVYDAFNTYATSSYFFTASGTSTTLTFSRSGNMDGQSPLLDNVRVAAVPEPSTLLAGAGALAGMGLLRKRK